MGLVPPALTASNPLRYGELPRLSPQAARVDPGPAAAGVTVTVGVTGKVKVIERVGVMGGVSVGRPGPMTGSVASAVGRGTDVGVGGSAVGSGLGEGRGAKVGQGVGVGAGRDGRATMMELITMLATMIRLRSHNIFWLRLLFWRLRLLTWVNLLQSWPRIIPQLGDLGPIRSL
jgi:hypothetical protein